MDTKAASVELPASHDADPDLKTGVAKAGGDSRRAHPRTTVRRPALVTEVDADGVPRRTWQVHTTDVSRSGIGLVSPSMAYLGRRLLIELSNPGQSQAKLLCGVVQQSRYSEGEGYIIGVQFCPAPETEILRTWKRKRKYE